MCAKIWETISACSLSKRPTRASLSAGIFLRSLPLANSASTPGSVVPCNERVEHRPAGRAEDARGDAVELDPGVLEDLVQPGGLALARVVDVLLER
jgi:hypothetical protein